jgi:RNA polymerase sigma-70 factor (ECF subfamily)
MEPSFALTLGDLVFGGSSRDPDDGVDGSQYHGGARRFRAAQKSRERMETDEDAHQHLLERIRAGDPAAFDAMVVEQLNGLVGFARSLLQSAETAEDAVQDVLARVWRDRAKLPARGSMRAYLFTAVRNRALDLLKHERVQRHVLASLRCEADASGHSAALTMDVEPDLPGHITHAQLTAIHRAFAMLPERQRSALALRYERQLKTMEVAAILGVSVKAAEQLLVRAIRTLRLAVTPT